MKPAVIIPTYWSRTKGEWHEGDQVFDHPTPLNEEGTLRRCLESLNNLKDEFTLILIAVPTHQDIQKNVERKITYILNGTSLKYDLAPIFPSTLEQIQKRVQDQSKSELFNLKGYPQVRNVCLLIPYLLGFETFIFLDDDEVVLDKDFVSKAIEHMGESFHGRQIVAKAGVYLQPHGTPFFKDKDVWWKYFLRSKEAMNETFKIIERGERIQDTPFAFGGNMVISREVVSQGICFDPYITRGEDIDFLVNVKSEGYAFVLDTALKIVHLPPPSSNPDWMKLRQDAFRFLYMRSKLQSRILSVKRNISASDLKPYPGRFLDYTLKPRLLVTSLLLSLDYAMKHMFRSSKEAICNIKLLFEDYHKLIVKYCSFKKEWSSTVQELIAQPDLKEILLERTVKNSIELDP